MKVPRKYKGKQHPCSVCGEMTRSNNNECSSCRTKIRVCRGCGHEKPLVSPGALCNVCRNKKPKNKASTRWSSWSLRFFCVVNYSPSCSCVWCKDDEFYESLELDHVNNDGSRHKRKIGNDRNDNGSLHRWAILNNFPPVLQVLCGTCHNIKTRTGKLPLSRKDKFAVPQNNTGAPESDRAVERAPATVPQNNHGGLD